MTKIRAKIIIIVFLLVLLAGVAYKFCTYIVFFHGEKNLTLEYGQSYQESGIAVYHLGRKTDYSVTGEVNNELGTYEVNYQVNGHTVACRIVSVVDTTPPVITLPDIKTVTVNDPTALKECTAYDDHDGDLSSKLSVSGLETLDKLGPLKIVYTVADQQGNETVAELDVEVVDDVAPVITINRLDDDYAILGKEIDLSYTVSDNYDQNVRCEVAGEVDFNKKGVYTVTYTATDSSGNQSVKVTTVNVQKANTRGIPVVMYHWFYDDTIGEKMGPTYQHNYVSKTTLTKQLTWLKESGYYFISWQQLSDYVDGKIQLPEHSIILTSDDAYEDFFRIAAQVGRELGIKLTSFVVTTKDTYQDYVGADYIDMQLHSDQMHQVNGSNKGVGLFMSKQDIIADLKTCSQKIGGNHDAFAYPYGHHNRNYEEAVREAGITFAFTTEEGRVRPGMNKLTLPRVRIRHSTSFEQYKKLLD